jgi:hypothetical protein
MPVGAGSLGVAAFLTANRQVRAQFLPVALLTANGASSYSIVAVAGRFYQKYASDGIHCSIGGVDLLAY